MRSLRILFLFLVFGFLSIQAASAQRLFFLFGNAEYASVTGELKSKHDKGLGVEAGLGIGMNRTFFTATTGFTWLFDANNNPVVNTAGTLRYTPVKIGVRRYLLGKIFFAKADIGLANMKYENVDGTSHFTASFGAGVKLAGVQVTGEYTGVTGWGSWLSLKAGYSVGL